MLQLVLKYFIYHQTYSLKKLVLRRSHCTPQFIVIKLIAKNNSNFCSLNLTINQKLLTEITLKLKF